MNQSLSPQNKFEFVKLVFILGLITLIGPLCIDMYLPSFLNIASNLQTSNSNVQLTVTTYLIGLAIGQPLYGPLIDRFGKKPLLIIGITIFIIASIGCALAQNITQLIIFRLFQSLGTCAAMVVPRAIIRDIFNAKDTTRILSYLIMVMGLGPIFAPVLGSFILNAFDNWRAIFWTLALTGILSIFIATNHIPNSKKADKRQKLKFALAKYRRILQDKNFLISSLASATILSCIFSYIAGAPIAYLDYFKINHNQFSLLFSLNSIGFVSASQINAYLLKKYDTKFITNILFKILCANSILLLLSSVTFSNFYIFTFLVFINLSLCGALMPNSAGLALTYQKRYTGSASALLGSIQFWFASLMSFLVGAITINSILPMSLIIAFCGISGYLIFRINLKLPK